MKERLIYTAVGLLAFAFLCYYVFGISLTLGYVVLVFELGSRSLFEETYPWAYKTFWAWWMFPARALAWATFFAVVIHVSKSLLGFFHAIGEFVILVIQGRIW